MAIQLQILKHLTQAAMLQNMITSVKKLAFWKYHKQIFGKE
jgi:hypothetical protein